MDSEIPSPAESEYGPEPRTDEERSATAALVAAMSVPEKLTAAIKGTREMRAILVRDPNRMVAMAVLSSPKLTESEIEQFARMGRASEDVLRTIGQSRSWLKHYPIVVALVRNAKTPLAVSLRLLPRLHARDMKVIAIDRNIPDPLRLAARRRVVEAM